MKCPECQSDHINKNGHRGQKQNYIYVNCGRQFIHSYETKGYSDDVKRSCLKMQVNGLGFRGIERVTGVSRTTIMEGASHLCNEHKYLVEKQAFRG